MSEMSVKARAAAKEKVKRLTSADPHQRVDSSTWSPPEAMDYHQQTGLRPIGRQERKRGGKVEGKAAHHHAGKKSRVHKDMGGPLASPISQGMGGQGRMAFGYPNARSPMQAATGMKHGGEAHKDEHEDRALVERMVRKRALTGKSHGGEIHHADCRCERCNGGAMANGGRAKRAFGGGDGAVDDHWIAGATKNKGALHRKLHVPEGEKIPAKKLAKAEHSRNPTERREADLARTLKRMNHANGGAAPANEWKPHREDDGDSPPQYEPRERTYREHHAHGGKASGKGKMNVNIIIAPKDGGGAQPMAGPPGGQPPIPPPPRAPMMPPGMMGGAPPMPGGPAPMGMPPGLASGMPLGGPGQLQMPRNRGGRAYPIDTGSGGAEARLEKIKAYGTKNP